PETMNRTRSWNKIRKPPLQDADYNIPNDGEARRTKRVFGAVLRLESTDLISIAKYLERIYKYTKRSPACFVVGFAYIGRLAHKHTHYLHYTNEFYARVAGVSNRDLNKMELELLFLLDFRVTAFESYSFHDRERDAIKR
ncbi:hypothetical protein HID58_043495, partial [Brassica napus]